jgi:hypothetical protein
MTATDAYGHLGNVAQLPGSEDNLGSAALEIVPSALRKATSSVFLPHVIKTGFPCYGSIQIST